MLSDFLKYHVDVHNCSIHSNLSAAWLEFFNPRLGMMVTDGVVTGHRKDAVSAEYKCIEVIGAARDYLVDKYLKAPEHIRDVTTETFCCDDTDYKVSELHYDPLVDLSPVIYAIERLSRWHEKHGTMMSECLVFEMALASQVKTNNKLRYSKFADLHYEAWCTNGGDPLPPGETFIGAFQDWLRCNYDSYDGNQCPDGTIEGAVRYQGTNILVQFLRRLTIQVAAIFVKQ